MNDEEITDIIQRAGELCGVMDIIAPTLAPKTTKTITELLGVIEWQQKIIAALRTQNSPRPFEDN